MSEKKTVWETKLPLPLAGRGKVRDIYEVDKDKLLIITTDRLSAFDVVLPNPIPGKGRVLTQISVFWFDYFKNTAAHHLITADVTKMNLPADVVKKFGAELEGRSMLVKKAKPLSVECVVRGYVTGSGWKDYLKTGAVCGHALPKGLKQCEKLREPIFTPATKESSGHDINIDFKETIKREGEAVAKQIEKISIELYKKGADYAATKGILIADTKFEFGILDGKLILIDEALTPDSSRFWPKDKYEVGHDQPSYDKQIVRNYLLDIQWNQQPPAPELPAEVIEKTSQAYRDVYERLVGRKLD
ncbi:MAG: phosphoribosylaminoimidazolesuccinocarboxamide synthase [Candidatus Omnitrophica bacterium]|nr:phosphoribosylaminoimidazolesuccinocarboxamide synthase [Candidatus Omnitrophota bacterium]